MKQIRKPLSHDKIGKLAIVAALFTGSALITALGVWFAVYSIINNVSLNILSAEVPGFVLAALVAYLGIRYFILVNKLSKEILKDSAYFSWSNFKKVKFAKSR